MAQLRARKRSKNSLAVPHSNLQDETNSFSKDFSASGNDSRRPMEDQPVSRGSVLRQRRQSLRQRSIQHEVKEELLQGQSQRSLFRQICADVRHLLTATFKLSKWLALLYVLWLVITHIVVATKAIIVGDIDHVCSLWAIGSTIPVCRQSARPLDEADVFTAQFHFENAVISAGKGIELATFMLKNEYAVTDLSIRVRHSGLSQKNKLVDELDQLASLTIKTSDDISSLASRIGGLAASAIASDKSAVESLQAIDDRETDPPLLLHQIIMSSLSPFSAFAPRYKDEKELKHIYMQTTNEMASRLPILIGEARELDYHMLRIRTVQSNIEDLLVLDGMKETLDEPTALTRLWLQLKRPDDYTEYPAHQMLLTELTKHYAKASEETAETLRLLQQTRSELDEFCAIYTRPSLVWRNVPSIDIMIMSMSESVRRLGAVKFELEGYQLKKAAQESTSRTMPRPLSTGSG